MCFSVLANTHQLIKNIQLGLQFYDAIKQMLKYYLQLNEAI